MTNRHGIMFALPLAAALALPVFAQDTNQPPAQGNQVQPTQPSSQTYGQASSQNSAQTSTSDTGRQPLELQSHEGFWGHLNPFARKKYVRRQLAPVIGRVNELDELTAENSRNIKDVDTRATEGIRLASLKASEADNHAIEAGNKANLAQQTAAQAGARLQTVEQVVGNIDQYQPVTQTEIRFRPGQQLLSKRAKDALDQIAESLKDQKGYVVEIQGFSSGRGQAAIRNSRIMGEAVTRYLVVQHDVPVYKIYMVGMGNVPVKAADGTSKRIHGGRIEISLMKNGVADLQQTAANSQAPTGYAGGGAMPQNDNPSNVAPNNVAPSNVNSNNVNSNGNVNQPVKSNQPVQQQPVSNQNPPKQ